MGLRFGVCGGPLPLSGSRQKEMPDKPIQDARRHTLTPKAARPCRRWEYLDPAIGQRLASTSYGDRYRLRVVMAIRPACWRTPKRLPSAGVILSKEDGVRGVRMPWSWQTAGCCVFKFPERANRITSSVLFLFPVNHQGTM
jgi:hypothetical protein